MYKLKIIRKYLENNLKTLRMHVQNSIEHLRQRFRKQSMSESGSLSHVQSCKTKDVILSLIINGEKEYGAKDTPIKPCNLINIIIFK